MDQKDMNEGYMCIFLFFVDTNFKADKSTFHASVSHYSKAILMLSFLQF